MKNGFERFRFYLWWKRLVVMGEDWHLIGCKFQSHHHIPDAQFFMFNCSKICTVCLKRPKINEK